MRIISKRAIVSFYEKHPIRKKALITWFNLLKQQNWLMPQDAVRTFGPKSVDVLKNDRLCIDVKGNNIRVIIGMNYTKSWCYIKWIGWHKEYDELLKNGLCHTIEMKFK